MRKRLACLAAAVLVGAAFARVSEICPPTDGAATLANPGCGFAGGGWDTLKTNEYVAVALRSPNQSKLWSLQKFSKGYVYNGQYDKYTNIVQKYCGTADIPLTEVALRSVADAFASCRANGGTVIPRFAYTWDGHGGCEPDDFEMIITHIRQLSAVVSEYADVIPAMECGIIGAYGEMHTSRYTKKEYSNRIIEAWLRNTPESIKLLIRSCPYIVNYFGAANKTELFAKADEWNQSDWRRIGFYNDGYLGTDADYGTWGSGSTTVFTRAEGIAFLEPRGDVPYGGEFAGIDETAYQQYNAWKLFDPALHNIVEEWYRTHLSYLRTFHASNMFIYQKLQSMAFNAEAYASPYLPDLHEYEGVDLMKFSEDHAGFRFVVRRLNAMRGARKCRLDLTIENTGFGQLLFPETKEIVLKGADDDAIVLPASGTDLRTLLAGKAADVSVTFGWPSSLSSGEYRLYLRERVPLKDETGDAAPRRVIAFANADAYDARLKANYLCTFTFDANDPVDALTFDWFTVVRTADSETVKGGAWEPLPCGRRIFRPHFASPVGHFVRWRGTVPVMSFGEPPELGETATHFSLAFLDRTAETAATQIVPAFYTDGGWAWLRGWAASSDAEGTTAELDVVFDLQSESPTARVTLDGVTLTTDSGAAELPLATEARQISSFMMELAYLVGSFGGSYWGVLEETIELSRPEFGGGAGVGGFGLVGTGDAARFAVTVANPVAGAYYTTFVAETLTDDFIAEGASVRAGAAEGEDGLLELSVAAPSDQPSKFVQIFVSSDPIPPGTKLNQLIRSP